MTLSKKLKLKNDEIKLALKINHKIKNNYMKVFCINSEISGPKLAVVVSKKTEKKSTGRNYIKRIIKNFFIKNKSLFHNRSYLIIVSKSFDKNNKDTPLESLCLSLEKLNKLFCFG